MRASYVTDFANCANAWGRVFLCILSSFIEFKFSIALSSHSIQDWHLQRTEESLLSITTKAYVLSLLLFLKSKVCFAIINWIYSDFMTLGSLALVAYFQTLLLCIKLDQCSILLHHIT